MYLNAISFPPKIVCWHLHIQQITITCERKCLNQFQFWSRKFLVDPFLMLPKIISWMTASSQVWTIVDTLEKRYTPSEFTDSSGFVCVLWCLYSSQYKCTYVSMCIWITTRLQMFKSSTQTLFRFLLQPSVIKITSGTYHVLYSVFRHILLFHGCEASLWTSSSLIYIKKITSQVMILWFWRSSPIFVYRCDIVAILSWIIPLYHVYECK